MKDLLRMSHWLLLAAVFYFLAAFVVAGHPQLETLCWKLGHITVGGFLGYWLDRHLLGRYEGFKHYSTPRVLARAIIVGCTILGVAFGL